MKIIIIISAVMSVLLLSGCSSGTQVRDRAFVQSAGIEYEKNGYRVALSLFDDDAVYTGKGKTFEDAVNNAEMYAGKDFYTGHMQIIAVDLSEGMPILEDLVNEDVSAGCLVTDRKDPLGYIMENDMEKVMEVTEAMARNHKYAYRNIRDILNSRTDQDQ